MNQNSKSDPYQRIDELCDRFEHEMKRDGNTPKIEEFLSFVSEDEKEGLFEELLHLEIELGDSVQDDLLKRFPHYKRKRTMKNVVGYFAFSRRSCFLWSAMFQRWLGFSSSH